MTASNSAQPFASINGLRITSGHVSIPYYGLWSAYLAVATPDLLPPAGDAVTISVGSFSAKGTVYRTAAFSGTRAALVMGGAAGWRTTLPEKSYSSSAGIRASLVLNDAASECGETVSLASDGVLSPDYARPRGPAIDTLRDIAGALWWMGLDGVTHVDSARPSSNITSYFDTVKWDGARGSFEIATESQQDWMPGNTFSSALVPALQMISLTTIALDNAGKLRLEILSTGATDG